MKIDKIAQQYSILDRVIERIKEVDGIEELYPPQTEALKKGILENKNFVLSLSTAAGKTLLSELVMLKSILGNNGRALYIVPLKALANEKYQDFKEKYEPLGVDVAISTGDYDSRDQWLGKFDIIISTSEKTDSLIRHRSDWISDIDVVVADEVHLMNSKNRGPTLEITLTRLREISPNTIFLLLSATISNAKELAGWIDGELLKSDFRPVKLYEGIYYDNMIKFNQKQNSKVENGLIKPTLTLAKNTLKKGKQALIFVSTRKSAEVVARRISKLTKKNLKKSEKEELEKLSQKIYNVLDHPTRQCKLLSDFIKKGAAFHHAGLARKQKMLIEGNFRNGLIDFVSSTPTLAVGVDLPAFRCIIRDSKRFYGGLVMRWIPTLEYKQMCLPFDEEIILSDGSFKKIGEIVEEKADTKVLTKSDKGLESKEILDYHKRKAKVFKIKTEIGSFKTTSNHPIKTIESWKEVKDLKEGDLLEWEDTYNGLEELYFFELLDDIDFYVMDCGDVLKEYKLNFDLTDRQLCERLGLSKATIYHYKNDRKACPGHPIFKAMDELGYSKEQIGGKIKKIKSAYGNIIEIPKKAPPEFMWLVGLVSTDGNLNKTKDRRHKSIYIKIRIFNTDKKIIKKAVEIFKHLGLSVYKEEKESHTRIEVGNTLLAKILAHKFDIPYHSKSKTIKIPNFIYKLPKNLLGGYLSGIFDGDGSYTEREQGGSINRRIHISTGSREFARGLQKLFHKIRCKATVNSRKTQPTIIRGEEAKFKGKTYGVVFRDIGSIKRFKENYKGVKELPDLEYSDYHNLNQYYNKRVNRVKVNEIKEKDEEVVYNITVLDNPNYFLSNGLLLHNCGRAGRPKYDSYGEAILVAKSEQDIEELEERYVYGHIEEIYSKLAVEPVLRMYVLTMVCEGYDEWDKLIDFFSKTFYGYQYGSPQTFASKIKRVLKELKKYEFIKKKTTKLEPTKIGKRVSELYLDPLTAHKLINFLKDANIIEPKIIAYLTAICDTLEMKPLPYVRKSEKEELLSKLALWEEELIDVPENWDYDYHDFLKSFKLSLTFNDWINEIGEDKILERYNIRPGTLFSKLSIIDWLLYASSEICKILRLKNSGKVVNRLRMRLKYGVKEELLDLVQIKGIGRVRARKLFSNKIKFVKDLKGSKIKKLKDILGPKIGQKVKKRVES